MLLTNTESRVVAAQSLQPADNVETLRRILTTRNKTEVRYDEAKEIAVALLEFYEILASEESDQDESAE